MVHNNRGGTILAGYSSRSRVNAATVHILDNATLRFIKVEISEGCSAGGDCQLISANVDSVSGYTSCYDCETCYMGKRYHRPSIFNFIF